MSLFEKLKTAIVGNPVTRDYEIGKHVASAGPGLLWRIHNGIKKTTRKEVSIFIYDKKFLEAEKLSKKKKEGVLAMLRNGPSQLIRLKHPKLLTVEHQLEESSDTLVFVTEKVDLSLANALGNYDNLTKPLPLAIKEYSLEPVEVQYGLLQLSEALDFLHSDVKLIHGNITPESIVITGKGSWKLMGFNFSSFSQYQSQEQVTFDFREWDSKSTVMINPSLDYLAPESILSKTMCLASDIYSLGNLIFAVYNKGRPLFASHNNVLSFKHNAEKISRISEAALLDVPDKFKHTVRSMLAVEPAVRPDALQVSKDEFFEEAGVSTLRYLGHLFEKTEIEKSQFFKKNLARAIGLLPKRVVHQHVLPLLRDEFRNHKMVPFVLPLVLLVAEDCSLLEYSDLILPMLVPVLKISDPIQVPLILLQKMDLILKKTSQDNVKTHILPMIITSLEANHRQIQELCVSILPTFASMVDYSSMKHQIIPRITALGLDTKDTALVVKSLVCIGQMLDVLDKHIILEKILPTLEQISNRQPGVLMAILGVYHEILKNKKLGIDKEMLATKVIPLLVPLSIEPSLNLKQFNQFMMVIRDMLLKVESEQQIYLEQLSSMEEQTKSTVDFAREVAQQKATDDSLKALENITGAAGNVMRNHESTMKLDDMAKLMSNKSSTTPSFMDSGIKPQHTTQVPQPTSSNVFDLGYGSSGNSLLQPEGLCSVKSTSPSLVRTNYSSASNYSASSNSISFNKTTTSQQALNYPQSNSSGLNSSLLGGTRAKKPFPSDNTTRSTNSNLFSGMQISSNQQTSFHQPLVPTQVGASSSSMMAASAHTSSNFQEPLVPTQVTLGQYRPGAQNTGHQPSTFQQPLIPTQVGANTPSLGMGTANYGMNSTWAMPAAQTPANIGLLHTDTEQMSSRNSGQLSNSASSWSTSIQTPSQQSKQSNESNPFADLSFLG